MEIREWAERILSADTLDEKLLDPGKLTDDQPGPVLIVKEPVRPVGMGFKEHSKRDKLPPIHTFKEADNRVACLHRFAGHELLAVEIMAYALLAFPEAPRHFRRGLANTLIEEQGHVRLYMERLEAFGVKFGDMPLYRHFWAHVEHITSPVRFVTTMNLTFEQANLDFAPYYGKAFSQVGDHESASLMKQILEDEIGHVSFGYNWLKKFVHGLSDWEAWTTNLPPTLRPGNAKGRHFQKNPRESIGLSEEWISQLQKS